MVISGFESNVVKCPPERTAGGMPEWEAVSIDEAHARTGFNKDHLRRLCRQDKLEYIKIGRIYLIRWTSLVEYMARQNDENDPDAWRYGPRKG